MQARRRLASQLVDSTPGGGTEKIVRPGYAGTIGSADPGPHARLESTGAEPFGQFSRNRATRIGKHPDLLELLHPFID
jgi:hypothetical protein